MAYESDLRKTITERLTSSPTEMIVYSYFDGKLRMGVDSYDIGQVSFSEVAHAVLDTLKGLYGEYTTVPRTFNAETYQNSRFSADVLALGSRGILEFTIKRKEAVM
jgi:hypothetical protein